MSNINLHDLMYVLAAAKRVAEAYSFHETSEAIRDLQGVFSTTFPDFRAPQPMYQEMPAAEPQFTDWNSIKMQNFNDYQNLATIMPDVIVLCQSNKIDAIKLFRSKTGCILIVAKDFVFSIPT